MKSWEGAISQGRVQGGDPQKSAPSPAVCCRSGCDHGPGPWGNRVAKIVSLCPRPAFAEHSQPPI